jgi:hypothetical protein
LKPPATLMLECAHATLRSHSRGLGVLGGEDMKLRLPAVALTIGCLIASWSNAQTGPYLSDLPRIYPIAYQVWTQSLPYSVGPLPEWLSTFNGVVTPIRDVTVHGSRMKFGTTCKPHDCADNIAGVLFSPQQTHVVAVAFLKGRNRAPNLLVVGQMSNAEFSCIQRLVKDYRSGTSC